VVKLHSTRIVW